MGKTKELLEELQGRLDYEWDLEYLEWVNNAQRPANVPLTDYDSSVTEQGI